MNQRNRNENLVKIAVIVGTAILPIATIFSEDTLLADALDFYPLVDPDVGNSTAPQELRGLVNTQSYPQYKFGEIEDDFLNYTDGSLIPTRTFSVERYNQTTGEWEVIGYANVHLHKVRVDTTDREDVSAGFTFRLNPKN